MVDALTALDQPTSDVAGVTLTKTGVLLILKVFPHSVYGAIAGCRVLAGVVKVHATAKVMRQSEVIFTGKIISLQHVKSKITKAQLNDECGVALKDFANFMPQDQIEVFE